VQHVFAENNLELNDIQNAQKGSNVEFNITINNAPNEVGAFGFEIVFNPDILSYQSYELGEGFKNRFNQFDDNVIGNDTIRFGGLSSNKKIRKGESGLLVTLTFTVLKADKDTITLQNLIDHFKGWPVKNGLFNQESLEYEDVNDDGKAGLAEVIHLLQLMAGFNN
jgi:hypothetical protein